MKSRVSFLSALLALGMLSFSSCSSDDNNNEEYIEPVNYTAYILNSGNMGSNSASFMAYDDNVKKAVNVFESANGIGLGDVGQDVVVYGSKTYVAVFNSALIYVLDKGGKIVSTIKNDAQNSLPKLEPRALEAYNGKVYVTLFDGYLARIDTTTLVIDKKIKVGLNPEAVKAVNNKLYVANSGGLNWQNGYYDKVSVVDPELTTQKEIDVAVNPCELKTDKNNNLFLVSRGNYMDVPNTLQQIDTNTDLVKVLDEGNVYSIFPIENKIYMLKKEYDANYMPSSSFSYYDVVSKKVVEESFITDGTNIADISYVQVDPVTKDIFVLAANGTNNGDGYVFSSTGKLKFKFDTGGAFPVGIWFLNK